jgi:hypothetical protein
LWISCDNFCGDADGERLLVMVETGYGADGLRWGDPKDRIEELRSRVVVVRM